MYETQFLMIESGILLCVKYLGIESQGWFRASNDTKEANVDSMMMSRLCALHWIIVLYESVVPDVLKADVRNSIQHCIMAFDKIVLHTYLFFPLLPTIIYDHIYAHLSTHVNL